MKKAILIVSVGTSQLEALEKTTLQLQKEIEKRFEDCRCYLAFSSKYILKKMREKSDETYFNITEALEQMLFDGIEEVVVQPTYLLNGLENDSMLEQIDSFRSQFKKVQVGKPLLSGKEDYIKVLEAILSEVALEEDEALVLVGHGSNHLSNSTYQNLEYTAYTTGHRQVLVGTMEGGKSQTMTLRKLGLTGYKKVRLMPLLFVAGYHAMKDIAADSDSWKSILEAADYQVKPALIGLGEIACIRDILMEHLEIAKMQEH